ncbi:hypothetical protein [Acetivibrio ethanolgignens]|uniref:hypothetical protein n=1 Tax=Acetivibrio ethanolgignens TaxID=290052 RepID=UPI0012DEA0F1|nr:hypothetical protein [Acetivibrio ethanolgignens]
MKTLLLTLIILGLGAFGFYVIGRLGGFLEDVTFSEEEMPDMDKNEAGSVFENEIK